MFLLGQFAASESRVDVHRPLTLMLSPRWQSPRMASQSEIVNDVPPPPDAVVSSASRDETASHDQLSGPELSCPAKEARRGAEGTLTANGFNEPGEHCGGGVAVGAREWRGASAVPASSLGSRSWDAGMLWGALHPLAWGIAGTLSRVA